MLDKSVVSINDIINVKFKLTQNTAGFSSYGSTVYVIPKGYLADNAIRDFDSVSQFNEVASKQEFWAQTATTSSAQVESNKFIGENNTEYTIDTDSQTVTWGDLNSASIVDYTFEDDDLDITYVFNTEYTQVTWQGEYAPSVSTTNRDVIQRSVNMFFELGGKHIHLMELDTSELVEGSIELPQGISSEFLNTLINYKQSNVRTDTDFIFVAISNLISVNNKDKIGKYIAKCDTLSAPYKIRFCLGLEPSEGGNFARMEDLFEGLTTSYGIDLRKYPVAIKLLSKAKAITDSIWGSYIDTQLAIGAFYTTIDLGAENSISDYCYTNEKLSEKSYMLDYIAYGSGDVLKEAMNYINFTARIANKIVNFGGNLTNGFPITGDFGGLACENDVIYSVLNDMLNKQYLTEQGITAVINTINNQLFKYVRNGYINSGTMYEGETKKIIYNGHNLTVITKNKSLPDGFYVFATPVAYLSIEDRNAGKFPPIYVIIQTLKGARFIDITGEIFA